MSLLPLSLGQAGSCEQFMSEARKCLLFLTSGKFFKITISTSLMGILAMTLLRPLNNIYWAHGTGQCILQLFNSLNSNNLLSFFPINWKLYFRYIGNLNFGSSLLQLLKIKQICQFPIIAFSNELQTVRVVMKVISSVFALYPFQWTQTDRGCVRVISWAMFV